MLFYFILYENKTNVFYLKDYKDLLNKIKTILLYYIHSFTRRLLINHIYYQMLILKYFKGIFTSRLVLI